MTEKATASKIDSFSVPDDGEIIDVFSLHLRGTTVHLSSIGATVLKFVTNSQGGNIDIVTGYKDAKIYHDTGNPHFFNGIVGRVANRIAGGKFKLNKKVIFDIYERSTKHLAWRKIWDSEQNLGWSNHPWWLGDSVLVTESRWRGRISRKCDDCGDLQSEAVLFFFRRGVATRNEC